jgi:CRISPR system Cascade subunit CasD
MQSWGVQSRFSVRDTGLEPSKSGVIGLLCAALGRPRSAPLADLAALQMGVRVDREGRLAYDYHTAQDVYRAKGGPPKETEPSTRYYLADACFLVGFESGDTTLLSRLHTALYNPVWPLYLGRKAFVTSEPPWLEDGLWLNITLNEALRSYPRVSAPRKKDADQVRIVLEDERGSEVRPDQPISFAERRFAPRRVNTFFITPPSMRSEALAQETP